MKEVVAEAEKVEVEVVEQNPLACISNTLAGRINKIALVPPMESLQALQLQARWYLHW